MISIHTNGEKIAEYESLIYIPDIAVTEPGYIKMISVKDSANAKHEYHAMAQMAYFEFQDGELETEEIEQVLMVETAKEQIEFRDGIMLCRKEDGGFKVLVRPNVNVKKILEAGYRYCTRWVRLDI
ncbi:hypothetical protein [Desulforhopalus singaporensis]|uniref:Uncharacterized protein n=1 Tax=Desulforhopalus singaporensis TaxID=91360 RepID=A0A1H0TNG4_9BACT|nr:hypothetical protein [Desulforhopalus singaporensis]SDP55549.1 hypothetical protein SAMN05660330_03179 [Desulforhopalus singaporensis]